MSSQSLPATNQVGSPEYESTEGLNLDDAAFARILEIYRKQVVVPDNKPERQFFLCPIGLVGSGKTTVLKQLAERFNLVRISTDEIRKLLGEQGYNRVRTAELAYTLIREFAEKGYSIAVDADCAGRRGTAIEKSAQELGMQIAWIHINPPEEFILNKLKGFKHTWLFKDANDSLASYYRRKPVHEKLDYNFAYVFDTSRADLPEQIEEAVDAIQALLKG